MSAHLICIIICIYTHTYIHNIYYHNYVCIVYYMSMLQVLGGLSLVCSDKLDV